MKLLIFFMTCLLWIAGLSQAEDLITLYGRVQEAWKQKNYPAVLTLSEELLAKAPGHSGVQFQYARALAANNKIQEALKILESVARMGGAPPARDDEAFAKIKDKPEFQSVLSTFEKNKTSSGRSTVAFSFAGKDLIPEGIAYDPVEKNFYIGSTYRRMILKVKPDGTASDFASEKEHGLWGMIGMEVDPLRRHLWANTANSGPRTPMIDPEPDTEGKTAIFKFDLNSRKLIKKYETGTKENTRFLNDLAIAPNGDVYISESNTGEVYRITAKKDELELFVSAANMEFPNGIAISSDGRWLYVAHFAGITVIDLTSGSKQFLNGPPDSQLGGHDGLVYYKDSLIGIQVLTGGVDRIVRFHLKNPQQVERIEILQINHPLFALPTTGDIAGDAFYYIANSQLRSFDEKGVIFPPEKLKDPVVLKINLL
jgi:sugar lactone lactonase YvrE